MFDQTQGTTEKIMMSVPLCFIIVFVMILASAAFVKGCRDGQAFAVRQIHPD